MIYIVFLGTIKDKLPMEKMLVVDDDPQITQLFREAFLVNGFAGDVINDSTLAISAITTQPDLYSAVIADIRMPGKSGIEIACDIREMKPSLSVILMSSNEQDYESIESSNRNLFSFLVKPKSVEETVNFISNLITE